MKTIPVNLSTTKYQIHVEAGALTRAGALLREAGLTGDRVVVITDPHVKGLHADALCESLYAAGSRIDIVLVPEGEQSKSLDSAARLYGELTNLHAERSTPILALGGGVIGDLAGFVAATYLRGVPFVQIPTTLLAQVDSSIGGKVAVDHGNLKNKIGAFYQPRLVISDTNVLKTLSRDDLASGLGEVIKMAVILDPAFFVFLERNIAGIMALDDALLEEVVSTTSQLKVGVVEKDEREENLRAILNFGHTIGHAVESVSNFSLKHGHAVALGMLAASIISNKMGMLSKEEYARLHNLIQKAGLPTRIPKVSTEKIFEAMQHDKKVLQNKVRFILPKAIGSVIISDEVTPALVEQTLNELYE